MKSIGIVGCGAIGRALLRAIDEGTLVAPAAGVTSRTGQSARAFLSTLRHPPPYLEWAALIERADLIVEAAGGEADDDANSFVLVERCRLAKN